MLLRGAFTPIVTLLPISVPLLETHALVSLALFPQCVCNPSFAFSDAKDGDARLLFQDNRIREVSVKTGL